MSCAQRTHWLKMIGNGSMDNGIKVVFNRGAITGAIIGASGLFLLQLAIKFGKNMLENSEKYIYDNTDNCIE